MDGGVVHRFGAVGHEPFNWVDLCSNSTDALIGMCSDLQIPAATPPLKRDLIAAILAYFQGDNAHYPHVSAFPCFIHFNRVKIPHRNRWIPNAPAIKPREIKHQAAIQSFFTPPPPTDAAAASPDVVPHATCAAPSPYKPRKVTFAPTESPTPPERPAASPEPSLRPADHSPACPVEDHRQPIPPPPPQKVDSPGPVTSPQALLLPTAAAESSSQPPREPISSPSESTSPPGVSLPPSPSADPRLLPPTETRSPPPPEPTLVPSPSPHPVFPADVLPEPVLPPPPSVDPISAAFVLPAPVLPASSPSEPVLLSPPSVDPISAVSVLPAPVLPASSPSEPVLPPPIPPDPICPASVPVLRTWASPERVMPPPPDPASPSPETVSQPSVPPEPATTPPMAQSEDAAFPHSQPHAGLTPFASLPVDLLSPRGGEVQQIGPGPSDSSPRVTPDFPSAAAPSPGELNEAGAADEANEDSEEDADLDCGPIRRELPSQLLPDLGRSRQSLRVAVGPRVVVFTGGIGQWILDAPRRFRETTAATKQQCGFALAFVCLHFGLALVFVLFNNGRLAIPPRL